jgi:hypothetical protein
LRADGLGKDTRGRVKTTGNGHSRQFAPQHGGATEVGTFIGEGRKRWAMYQGAGIKRTHSPLRLVPATGAMPIISFYGTTNFSLVSRQQAGRLGTSTKRPLPIGSGQVSGGARFTRRAREPEASLTNSQFFSADRGYSAAKRVAPSGRMFARLNALPSRAIS